MTKELKYLKAILVARYGKEGKLSFWVECDETFTFTMTYGVPETCAQIMYISSHDDFDTAFAGLCQDILSDNFIKHEE